MASPIITRRTRPLNGRQVKALAREIAKRAGKPPIEIYSGTDTNFHDFFREEVVPFGELDAFASTIVLSASHRFPNDADSRAPFAEACRRHGSNRARLLLQLYGTEATTPGPLPSNFDLNLAFGWQTDRRVSPLS